MGCIAVAVLSCNLMLLVVRLLYKLVLKKNILLILPFFSDFITFGMYRVVLMSSVFQPCWPPAIKELLHIEINLLNLSTLSIALYNMVTSSLQSKEEKDELITKIKNGDLHIIVGTHALLTERMAYSNLGLLVVDEEQVPLRILLHLLFQSLKFCLLLLSHLCVIAVLVWWCYVLLLIMMIWVKGKCLEKNRNLKAKLVPFFSESTMLSYHSLMLWLASCKKVRVK